MRTPKNARPFVFSSLLLFAACGVARPPPDDTRFPPKIFPPDLDTCVEAPNDVLPRCEDADPSLPLTHGPLSFSFPALQFGWQTLNHRVTRTLRITNDGTGEARIENTKVIGAGFSVDDAVFPIHIAAGGHADIQVSFQPTRRCCQGGTLSFATPLLATPISIPLSGTGVTETAITGMDPLSIDFNDIAVGKTRTREIWLWSAGTEPSGALVNLGLGNHTLGWQEATAALPFMLDPGEHFSVRLAATPQDLGERNEMIYFIVQRDGFEATLQTLVRFNGVPTTQPATH